MEEEHRDLRTDAPTEKDKKYGEKKTVWHINKNILPYKLHFFLVFGGSAAVIPFMSAFGITVLGLTASNIAASYTACQVFRVVFHPVIGYIADYFNRLKSVIAGLAILQAIFCLLLIFIPNKNMPGNHATQFAVNSQNTICYQFCFNSKSLEINSKRSLDKDKFARMLPCFSNNATEIFFKNCSSQYLNSTNTENDHVTFIKTTCKLSTENSLSPENYEDLEDAPVNKSSFDLLYINISEFSFICLLPANRLLFHTNFSSHDFNEFCYSVSNESSSLFNHLYTEPDLTSTDCDKLPNYALHSKDEHSVGFANFMSYQFWLFAICIAIIGTCLGGQFSMSDTICYQNVHGADYGQQRLWGAISWGLIAPFAGYLNGYTEGYLASWLLHASITILLIWNLSRINFVKPDFSLNVLKDMKKIFSSKEFLCFELGVFMNGMYTGIIMHYLAWFIVSIGGKDIIIGLVQTIQCFCGEVPAMYFSGWLIKKLGHFNIVSLAIICHGIRFLLYSYLHNPWWILPIEILDGFTYGSFYAAMTSFGKLHSKSGTEATTQSVLSTTYNAQGGGMGTVITGICLDYFGGHTTFFYVSILCVISTLINIVSTLIINYRKRFQNATTSASMEIN